MNEIGKIDSTTFPLEAWGQVCRHIYNSQIDKSRKFPVFCVVRDTAKLAVCSEIIDKSTPMIVNFNFPGIVFRDDEDKVETKVGDWQVSFLIESGHGSVKGHDDLISSMEDDVPPPGSSFDEQWADAWKAVEQEDVDLDVMEQSDRTVGLWVWGAVVYYLKQAQKNNLKVQDIFQDMSVQWISRVLKDNQLSVIHLLPGCSNISIQKTVFDNDSD